MSAILQYVGGSGVKLGDIVRGRCAYAESESPSHL